MKKWKDRVGKLTWMLLTHNICVTHAHGPMRVFTGMLGEHSVSLSCHKPTGVEVYPGCPKARSLLDSCVWKTFTELKITARSDLIGRDWNNLAPLLCALRFEPVWLMHYSGCLLKIKRCYWGRLDGEEKWLTHGARARAVWIVEVTSQQSTWTKDRITYSMAEYRLQTLNQDLKSQNNLLKIKCWSKYNLFYAIFRTGILGGRPLRLPLTPATNMCLKASPVTTCVVWDFVEGGSPISRLHT